MAIRKDPIAWNPQRIYSRIKRAVANNRDIVLQSEQEIQAAARHEAHATTTSYAVMSTSNGAAGVVGLMEGNSEALDRLYHAVYYGEANLRYILAYYLANQVALPLIEFNDASLELARAVTLGCRREAEQIAETFDIGLAQRRRARGTRITESAFATTHLGRVAPFVLQMYADWRNRPFPLEGLDLASMDAYEPLLALWRTDNLQELEQAIIAACDLHIARSKHATNTKSYEFELSEYWLHPVEILMLLRLREQIGLPNPIVSHPLLMTPTGRLHPVRSVPRSAFLDPAIAWDIETVPSRLWRPQPSA